MSCNCKYITLFRGDDSDFEFNQKVSLVIKTDLDLSGCSAHFSLLGVQQDFNPIPADKTLELVFPSADTSKFPLGMANGKMWLTDAEGRIRTVSNSIHFYLTNNVEKAYGDSSEQTITVDIQSIGNYDALSNKPSINGVTLIGNKTGEELGLADEAAISAFREELSVVEGHVEEAVQAASAAESSAASAVSAASDAQDTAADALAAAETAQQTADDATSALDSKRDVTDLLVRGNPTGEGSWFSVNGDAYSYSDGTWTRAGSPFSIYYNEFDGTYVITGSDDVTFTLDADYSASVTYLGTAYTIVGYVDTLAKVSEIPTSTSQLTNDSGFITSDDVHGDYIEDAAGNRINADLTYSSRDWKCWRIEGTDNILTGEKGAANNQSPDPEVGDVYYGITFRELDSMWELNRYTWYGTQWINDANAETSGTIEDTTVVFEGWETVVQESDSGTIVSNADLAAALADKKDKQSPVVSPSASGNSTSFIDSISQDANGVITPTKKTIPAAAPSTSGAGGTAGLMSAADKEKLNGIAAGATKVSVDAALSDTSTNPVQNKAVKEALDGKRGMADLSYSPDDWFVTGAAEMQLVRDSSVQPPRGQWSATVAGETWVLLYNGAFWRFGTTGATAEDEESGADATSLTFNIDGSVYNLTKGSSLALTSDIPSASTATPQMDGTASAGSGTEYSRGDHVHPSDTGKLDGVAAYPEWDATQVYYEEIVSYNGRLWYANGTASVGAAPPDTPWVEKRISELLVLKQDALTSAQLANIEAVPNKANTSDVNAALAQKADASDLPYALVTPGEWEFSGLPEDDEFPWSVSSGPTFTDDGYGEVQWVLVISNGNAPDLTYRSSAGDVREDDLTVVLRCPGMDDITATRPSLPGHLLDRAGNRVVVSGATELTLPAAVPGYLRDFLVRLEISGSTVPTITFSPDGNESVTYETDGEEFPVPDEVGNWVYSFTENCVAHTFAVALKKVNEVSQT